jgi:hypothetical protein
MNRFWKTLLVAPVLAASAGASHAAMRGTLGLGSATEHVHDHSISFRGTETGVGKARPRIALADAPSAEISIHLNLIRFERDADGRVRERVSLSPLISAPSHARVVLGIKAKSPIAFNGLSVAPVLNQDGTVTLTVTVDQPGDPGETRPALVVERRLPQNTQVRMLGLTNSEDKLLRRAVEAGEVVNDRGPYTATYFDVTVQRVTKNPAK